MTVSPKQRQAAKSLLNCLTATFRGEGAPALGTVDEEDSSMTKDANFSVKIATDTATLSSAACNVQRTVKFSSFSCSALSLEHETSLSASAQATACATEVTKKQAEEYAASLLTRPVLVVSSNQDNSYSTHGTSGAGDNAKGPFTVASLRFVPAKLLHNLFASTMVLIQCRLRNYVIFLARHGISLAHANETSDKGILGIEKKLHRLLTIGQQLVPHQMTLKIVECEGNVDNTGRSCQATEKDEPCVVGESDSDFRTSCRLLVTVDFDLTRPCPDGREEKETLMVTLQALGAVQVTFDSTARSNPIPNDADVVIDKVDIQFDTTALLNDMIQQASRVVAAVVHMANTASIVPESRLPRSASFLAMPPPSQHCASSQWSAASSSDQYDVEESENHEHLRIEDDCFPDNNQVMHGDREKKTFQARSFPKIVSSEVIKPLNLAPARNSAHLSNTCIARLEPVTDDEEAYGAHREFPSLSPDECENIVDEVFGGLDDSILHCCHSSTPHQVLPTRLPFLPPRKKLKTVHDAPAFAH